MKIKNIYLTTFFVCIIKVIVLGFFYFQNQRLSFFEVDGIALNSLDTSGYITPILNYMDGQGYGYPCRMPGFMPIICFLLLFTSSMVYIKSVVVILQIIVASFAIAIIISYLKGVIQNKLFFYIAFFLLAANTYVGIWDIYITADSFASSFTIIAIFLLLNYPLHAPNLFLSALLLSWAVFFRSAAFVFIPIFVVYIAYIAYKNGLKQNIAKVFCFGLPIVVIFGAWTYRNYQQENELIVLTGNKGCFSRNPVQFFEMIKIPAALGMDFTWGMDGEYFIDRRVNLPEEKLKTFVTKDFSLDELLDLRSDYLKSIKDSTYTDIPELINRMALYRKSYQGTYPLKYYIINPLRLTVLFLFPSKLDNLITPKKSEMNILEFGIKSAYFISLWLVSLFFLLNVCLVAYRTVKIKRIRQHLFELFTILLALAFILVHSCILGYIEQRYLAGAYLLMLLNAVLFINQVLIKLNKNKVSQLQH